MEYTVRSASLDDLPILTAFTLAEARAAEGRELDLERVQSGVRTGLTDPQRARYWVLVDETGNPAGSISVVREWSDWQAGDYWWVQSVYLVPEVRGRGLLSKLLAAVKVAAVQAGALELRLYVHRDNQNAVRAYRRAGFAATAYEIFTLPLGEGTHGEHFS